jgi:replicative DNA helicase
MSNFATFKEESVNHDLDPLRDETALQRLLFGALLVDERAWTIAITCGVTTEWFATPAYGTLWQAALRLHEDGAPLDPVLLHEASGKVISHEDIASCAHGVKDASGVEAICRRLRALYLRRKQHELLSAGIHAVQKSAYTQEETSTALRPILASLEELSLPAKGQRGADRLAVQLDALLKRGDGTEDTRRWTTTGVPDLDRRFGACEPGKLWVMAARSHTGKSAMNHWLNYCNLRAGRTVFHFPNEDRLEDAVTIMAGQAAGVNLRQLNQEPQSRLADFYREYKWICDQYEKTFFCWDQIREYDEIGARVRVMLKKGVQPDSVSIDHLCRVRLKGKWDRTDQMFGEIASSFRALAQSHNFTAIATSQLNRGALEHDREPTERDAAESDKIFQEADRYWILWVPKKVPTGPNAGEEQDDDTPMVRMLVIQKKGRGEGTGRHTIRFLRQHQRPLDNA